MRHNSPVASFNSHDGRRAAHSPHRIQPDLNQSIREPRGVTPMGKLVKVTVHPSVLHQTVQQVVPVQTSCHQTSIHQAHPTSITLHKQVIRPVERRVTDKLNFQTVQLYEKSTEYVSQCDHGPTIDHLQNENQRLMAQLHDYHCQIESWRIKYGNLEKEFMSRSDRTPEVETYKALLNENRECFNHELNSLRFELQHQKGMFQQNEQELMVRINKHTSTIEEYENKLTLITTEIQHMNMMLVQKQATIDQLRLDEKDARNLETQIKVRDDIIEERNQEIGNLRRQLLRVPELEDHIFLAKAEIERLYGLLHNLETELDDKLRSISSMEIEISRYQTTIENMNRDFNRRIEDTLMDLRNRDQYCDELENKVSQLSTHINQLDKDLDLKSEQLNQRTDQLNQRSDQTKQLKEECQSLWLRLTECQTQMQHQSQEIQDLQYSKGNYQDQLNSKMRELSQLTIQLADLESLSGRLRLEYETSNNKCEEYARKLCLLSTEIENLTNKYKIKTKEYEDLNNLYRELQISKENETSLLQEKCNYLCQDIARLQEYEISYHKSEDKCALLCQETERLLQVQQDLQRTINQLQITLDQKDTLLQESELHSEKLQRSHIDLQRSQNDLRNRYEDLERRYQLLNQDKEQVLLQLENEIKRFNAIQDEYKLQLQQVLNEKNQIHQQSLQYKELISKHESTIALLATENERLQQLLNSRQTMVDQLQIQITRLEEKLTLVAFENERLNEQWNSINRQNQLLREQVTLFEEKNNHLQRSCSNLEENNILLQKEIERMSSSSQSQMESMEIEIVEIKESNSWLTNELDSWKKKFIALNREFHKTQEDYMMVQAEFDAMKQRKVTKEVEVTRKSVMSTISTITIDKENRKSMVPLVDIN